MRLALYHDTPVSEPRFDVFHAKGVLAGLKALDARAKRKGLESLDPTRSLLVRIGTEHNPAVTKNSYGVLNLSWQAATESAAWAETVRLETATLREAIQQTHGVPLKFLIWAGMGGSAEDKSMYNACGLLNRGPKCYVLDSTDPAKLAAILADMRKRSGLSERETLKRTLVVGMAMGMTSYEPVVNLERLAALYARHKIEARPNFLYMTLSGSLLDQFAQPKGFKRIELQLDGRNSTAGRHTGPLTRGSLYPLALAGVDLDEWISAANLPEEDIDTAWRLAAFLDAQGAAGRDKVTLLCSKEVSGAGVWTKQDFEESLGKSEEIGIKIVLESPVRLTNYRAPKDPRQDRLFLAIARKGDKALVEKTAALRRAGYPVAVLTLDERPLSAYMQFIHYAVFGLGYLRQMNFVTQPSVELYKSITSKLMKSPAWERAAASPNRAAWRNLVTLRVDHHELPSGSAPSAYAQLLAKSPSCYGELTFFGDTRYDVRGKAVRAVLDRAAELVFRKKRKQPVDVYEGPAMNHSYHEMIIGHGGCFSTIVIADANSTSDDSVYHRTQFLATEEALAQRGREVVAIHLKDLSERSLDALDEFFREAARALPRVH